MIYIFSLVERSLLNKALPCSAAHVKQAGESGAFRPPRSALGRTAPAVWVQLPPLLPLNVTAVSPSSAPHTLFAEVFR